MVILPFPYAKEAKSHYRRSNGGEEAYLLYLLNQRTGYLSINAFISAADLAPRIRRKVSTPKVGYSLNTTTTLFLPSRTWFVFDALIGLDAFFLSRANGSLHYPGTFRLKRVFPSGISWTLDFYLNYSEFFSLILQLVNKPLPAHSFDPIV